MMSKKLTTEEFIKRAKGIHGDKYDYSLVDYVNSKTKVKIICKEHNIVFEQEVYKHLSGYGVCPMCSRTAKLTTEIFIKKAQRKHGDKYDYSLVDYVNNKTKVKIICKEHNIVFEQEANRHLYGYGVCPMCSRTAKLTTEEFIKRAKEIHGDKYDYSLVDYVNNKTKVKIICKEHNIVFEQLPKTHLKGCDGCPICSKTAKLTTETFIKKAKEIHGDKYDYSLVDYVNTKTKVKIICKEHNIVFEQEANRHLHGHGVCPMCSRTAKLTTEEFIKRAKEIHGDKYDYSKVNYVNNTIKLIFICPIHGEFEQLPSSHLNGNGCIICNIGFTKQFKLNLLNDLSDNDLLSMDSIELLTIIKQGNLPTDFLNLIDSVSNSEDRVIALKELKEKLSEDTQEINNDKEIRQIDDVDDEILLDIQSKFSNLETKSTNLKNIISGLQLLDKSLYSTMNKESFDLLLQYRIRKLWNDILNNKISVSDIENINGGKYYTMIKNSFLLEYNEIYDYEPPKGYNFPYQPNLMQKLTINRLIKNKYYGNWSGTGAGKTLSFIISSREIDAKLTLVIGLNSTIKQTCESIKETYPNSVIYTEYEEDFVFDKNQYNYLVLNYEKFQQKYSEKLYQNLTNNNQIDFIVVDEVHNAKQRSEKNEVIRCDIISRLIERVRINNDNLHLLIMSATPVINNLFEAKSLLQLMTGLEYDDLSTKRTLINALEIFKQLTLNGLRYIPNYDISEEELTGSNLSNLNIDGSHLVNDLLLIHPNRYFDIEKLLLNDKLNTIKQYLRKGVVIYTYYTDGIINIIKKFVQNCGFTVGVYTGSSDATFRTKTLNDFIDGKIDILIGSKPIGTGVDGLQKVCNRAIMITLPWTDSEYQQFKGRIYRQGSKFETTEIIIPQVKIELENGEFWSWDIQRLNIIKNKRTLTDACVDGLIPSKVLPTAETLFKKAQESLLNWKNTINEGNIITTDRNKIQIELYPEIKDLKKRKYFIKSELSEFNRRCKIMRSENMHEEFTNNPSSFFRYHQLRKERMNHWEEIPYEYIATKIRNKKHIVADFGCGENKFKDCISNEVYSFDHVAFDDTVITCDMKKTTLENESIDVAVFSLSLWGVNYEDYIKEAYRVLNFGGIIYIAEPSKSYDTKELKNELKKLLIRNGFEIVGDIEDRGKFIYIKGYK